MVRKKDIRSPKPAPKTPDSALAMLDDDEEWLIDLGAPPKVDLKKGIGGVKAAAIAPLIITPPTGLALDLMPELITAAERYFGEVITGLTEVQKLVVINFLRLCNPSRAAAGVGVSVVDHQRWLRENVYYRSAFEAAEEVVTDLIEEVGIRRGLMGSEKLLIALLKGRRHKKYNPMAAMKNPNQDGPQSWADLSRKMAEEAEEDDD